MRCCVVIIRNMYIITTRLATYEWIFIRTKIQTFLGLKTAENVLMHKSCLTSQFVRLSLARFFREGKYAILRENPANESLRNCDVRQVLCIKTFSAIFKPKNVCIFAEFSSFQSFQSEIILVKCCKEVSAPLKLFFPDFTCLSRNIFVCKFVYIFRTDENPFGSCQPCRNNIHITYDDNTAAHRATCGCSMQKLQNRTASCTRNIDFH